MMIHSKPRIIVALDFDQKRKALELSEKLDPKLCRLKVGKEMFTRFGPEFVKQLIQQGFDIFLDLKFHDIPNTVAKACCAAADLGVWMLNVHASGGEKMMTAAREAIDSFGQDKPLLIAVTLLTSLSKSDLKRLGCERSLEDQVLSLARLSHQCGLNGVVCSAQEATLLKQNLGADFTLVTPGIRLKQSDHQDQVRIATPDEAIAMGADYLVIGRSITQASDSLKVVCDISESIDFLLD